MKNVYVLIVLFLSYLTTNASDYDDMSKLLTFSEKEEEIKRYAYSFSLIDNVGCLSVITPRTILKASAVYIGGKICITCANTYRENGECAVKFEVDRTWTEPYKVMEYIVHENYKNDKLNDIAILILEKEVKELNGVQLYYEFLRDMKQLKKKRVGLYFSGYGSQLIWNRWFRVNDGSRKSAYCTCFFSEDSKNSDAISNHIVTSAYCDSIENCAFKKLKDTSIVAPYHMILRPGMGGGGAFYSGLNCDTDLKLVGIYTGTNGDYVSNFVRYCIIPLVPYINSLIVFCSALFGYASNIKINEQNFYTRTASRTLTLAPYKEWIENIRLQQNMDMA